MNIQSMVSMGFMMRSVKASLRKDESKVPDQADNFEKRLYDFREEHAMEKLREPEKQVRPDKKDEDDWRKVSCSSQLFSAWDSSLSAEDSLKKLDANLSQIGEYTVDSKLGATEALEHIAAQYSVYKRHIADTGDKEQLAALDKMIEQYTSQYAKELGDTVGGFYESNGMTGERDRVQASAMDSVRMLTTLYDGFISKNAGQFNQLEADASQTGKSLSNELRKAVRESGIVAEGSQIDNYNSAQLGRLAKLAKVSANIGKSLANAKITNEEELGVLLGKSVVQALAQVIDPYEMDRHEAAFLESIQKHADKYMDKVDALLSSEVEKYKKNNPEATLTPYSPLDRDAVQAVMDAMAREYKETQSSAAALEKGKACGLKQYTQKADVESKTTRYQSSAYWEQLAKDALGPANRGARQYRWIQKLLESGTNSWLNVVA